MAANQGEDIKYIVLAFLSAPRRRSCDFSSQPRQKKKNGNAPRLYAMLQAQSSYVCMYVCTYTMSLFSN